MKVNLTIGVPDWLDRIFAWPMMWYRRRKYGYDFRRIDLGEHEFTIVEPRDYYRLANFKWYLAGRNGRFYALRQVKVDCERTMTSRMHREIMDAPRYLLVDHRNSNTLDNRRANLRLATHKQNTCNRRKRKSKTSSKYIGVYYEKRRKQYVARIYCNGKKIWLGQYEDEIAAAKAYDEAAKKYHGEFARLNFPSEAKVPEK